MDKAHLDQIVARLKGMYGDAAAMEAARIADDMLSQGHIDDYNTWTLIVEAVREHERRTPRAGGPLN